jgi:hypothetical protein
MQVISFLQVFMTKILYVFLPITLASYMLHPSQLPSFYHASNICWRTQITELLIMYISAATSYQLRASKYIALEGFMRMSKLEAEEDHEKYV